MEMCLPHGKSPLYPLVRRLGVSFVKRFRQLLEVSLWSSNDQLSIFPGKLNTFPGYSFIAPRLSVINIHEGIKERVPNAANVFDKGNFFNKLRSISRKSCGRGGRFITEYKVNCYTQ
jgi:hypothetical protein